MDGSEAHAAAVAWFTSYQLEHILRNGAIPDWFHGIITRKFAEDLLFSKPAGYFLIRVSESRIGYTLSYRVQDRCRHFMIDVLPDNRYVIVGEAEQHKSLQDLVSYHRKVPILPFNEVITMPCGQETPDKVDYAELIFNKSHGGVKPTKTGPLLPRNTVPTAAAGSKDSPPALPHRSNSADQLVSRQSQNVSLSSASGVQPRIYPCLEAELGAFQAHPVGQSPKPVPLPRKKHLVTRSEMNQPPELPARECAGHCKEPALTSGRGEHAPNHNHTTLHTQAATPGMEPPQPRLQDTKLAINLNQFRKRFQKRRAPSEDHTYTEINDQPGLLPRFSASANKTQTENEYEELPSHSSDTRLASDSLCSTSAPLSSVAKPQGLPAEYMPPPPFAPGY